MISPEHVGNRCLSDPRFFGNPLVIKAILAKHSHHVMLGSAGPDEFGHASVWIGSPTDGSHACRRNPKAFVSRQPATRNEQEDGSVRARQVESAGKRLIGAA